MISLRLRILQKGARPRTGLLLFLFSFLLTACSLLVTRPVQEMSDTAAAIRAAKEVQADIQAPNEYRLATEWFFKAKKEYRFKNFIFARDYAKKARIYAERAELNSVLAGTERLQQPILDPFANATERLPQPHPSENPPPTPTDSENNPADMPQPEPQGTPAEEYEKRREAELTMEKEKLKQQSVTQNPGSQPQGANTPTFIPYPSGKMSGLK